jgi:CRP-like cAMP-binding protein
MDGVLAVADEVAVDGQFYECKPSEQLIDAFEKNAIRVVCSEAQVLFNAGESGSCVYFVEAGNVRLLLPLTPNDGMGFCAQAGSFVGLPAAFSNEAYSMSAIAQKGAELLVMSREKFCDLIASSPALSLDVLRILAAETRAARIAMVGAGMARRGRSRD